MEILEWLGKYWLEWLCGLVATGALFFAKHYIKIQRQVNEEKWKDKEQNMCNKIISNFDEKISEIKTISNDKESQFYESVQTVQNNLDKSDKIEFPFNEDTVYTVWTCKTLQNWKALISTSLKDGMYYECTYDGDKKKLYLDAYKKFEHQEIEFDNETEEKIKQENRVAATSSVKVRSFPRNE